MHFLDRFSSLGSLYDKHSNSEEAVNRDALGKLNILQESKSLLKAERLKEKLGKQDFHYDMEDDFEPVTHYVAKVGNVQFLKNQEKW